MAKEQTKPKGKIGRNDRYPSDYGVRDHAQEKHEDGSWVPGGRGQGREGQSKGYGRSGGNGTGPSGLQSKKRRSDNEGS